MQIDVQRQDAAAIVRLNGRLDPLSAADVKGRLGQVVADGARRVVVDLGEVPFIDSSGLGALIGGLKAARQAGGDLRLARPAQQAQTILELTTLNRVLRPYATVEEALAGF
ncbi:MAG TPA: STAS domain-containing protein [Chloroflexota bacterium]